MCIEGSLFPHACVTAISNGSASGSPDPKHSLLARVRPFLAFGTWHHKLRRVVQSQLCGEYACSARAPPCLGSIRRAGGPRCFASAHICVVLWSMVACQTVPIAPSPFTNLPTSIMSTKYEANTHAESAQQKGQPRKDCSHLVATYVIWLIFRKGKLVWCPCHKCLRAGDPVRGMQVSKSTRLRHDREVAGSASITGTKRKSAHVEVDAPIPQTDQRDGEPMELGDAFSVGAKSSVHSGSGPSSPASAPASSASGQ